MAAPPPSDIPNVFGMNEPQHMLTKLYIEIQDLSNSLSVWTKSESFPRPVFIAWNVAVTAWHITDWLWASKQTAREKISKKFAFTYNEGSISGREKGLTAFQYAVREACRELHICREICNASKHMRLKSNDPDVRVEIEWHEAKEAVGHVKVGDLIMDLFVYDKNSKIDAQLVFIEAAGYWETLLKDEGLIDKDAALPSKIIPASQQPKGEEQPSATRQ
jgi:hypothetical protein